MSGRLGLRKSCRKTDDRCFAKKSGLYVPDFTMQCYFNLSTLQALPEKSSEEIAQENESLRNENIQLENEIKEEQKAEAEATELGDKLNDVDNKIDELTPSSTLSSSRILYFL